MMTNLDSVGKAVTAFMESEILPRASQGKRLPIGMAILVMPKLIETKYHELYPYISMMGLGTEDGNIDIDKVENTLIDLMGKYGDYMMELFGVHVSINQNDVHKLANLVRTM